MSQDAVQVAVRGLSVDPGDSMPLVILCDETGEAGLELPIGPFEASAIILELEGIAPPRPLTHDLLAEFFREGGLALQRAELYGESASEARARLVYRRGLRRLSKEVRPSDALALSLRLKAPICVERSLLGPRPGRSSSAFAQSPETPLVWTESSAP